MGYDRDEPRGRILIVDDEPEIRRLLAEVLGERHDCDCAGSADEALSALARSGYDLLLSDISMPGMTGLDMLPHVARLSPATVVVMISALQNIESAVAAMRVGAFDYLTKPFHIEHVTTAVARALEHARLREAKRRHEERLEELVALRTAELRDALATVEESYRATLTALTAALDARDRETCGHSRRVVAYSLRLGREMGLDAGQLHALEFGALLHDIGKIGVPDAILRKRGRLDAAEWEQMRRHPLFGGDILSGIGFLRGAARVVVEHHERWDGTGYPAGLRREEIDLNSRIFAVADAFDAMTSDRVYRAGKPYAEALRELGLWAGLQFDPAVVAAFAGVAPHEWDELRRRCARADAAQAARDDAPRLAPANDHTSCALSASRLRAEELTAA